MKKYDVFISYRRDGGSETAKLIRDSLTEKGYKVFLDVESLRSGPFNTELYSVIENSKDFLLILPENSLDRCANEGDWLRLEIEHAQRCGKNIVPIMLKKFSFPQVLPASIEFLRTQNGLVANIEYYDAFIKHLEEFLHSRINMLKSKRFIIAVTSIALVGAILFGSVRIYIYYNTNSSKNAGSDSVTVFPSNDYERETVHQLVDYISENLATFDLLTDTYKTVSNETISYLRGNYKYSIIEIMKRLDGTYSDAYGLIDKISDLPIDLQKRLDKCGFDTEMINNYIFDDMSSYIKDYMVRLVLFYAYIDDAQAYETNPDTANVKSQTLLGLLETGNEVADLYSENIFYSINEIILPINDESELKDFKTECLSNYTSIYSKYQDFTSDLDVIKGKKGVIKNQLKKLSSTDSESLTDFYRYIYQVEYMGNGKQVDNTVTLWYQGINELLSQKVIDCVMDADTYALFELFNCLVKGYDNDSFKSIKSALEYISGNSDIGGLLVISYYDTNTRHEVKIGDIIYEINGTRLNGASEDSQRFKQGTNQVKVYRLNGNEYNSVDLAFDTTLESPNCLSIFK